MDNPYMKECPNKCRFTGGKVQLRYPAGIASGKWETCVTCKGDGYFLTEDGKAIIQMLGVFPTAPIVELRVAWEKQGKRIKALDKRIDKMLDTLNQALSILSVDNIMTKVERIFKVKRRKGH